MAYSKFLRQSNCLINRSIKTVRLSNLLKSQSKVRKAFKTLAGMFIFTKLSILFSILSKVDVV